LEILEQFINSLKKYMVLMFYQYPVMETTWFSMDRVEQAVLSEGGVGAGGREGRGDLDLPQLE
jgi:hypothetical protein